MNSVGIYHPLYFPHMSNLTRLAATALAFFFGPGFKILRFENVYPHQRGRIVLYSAWTKLS